MRLNLLVTQGSNKGKGIPINKAEFVIGRDPSCNLRPNSQAVSKRHCILRIRSTQAFVEDLKSTNGTFLNDEQLQGEKELHDGDRLKIGPLDFVVQLEAAAQADKPTQVEKEPRDPTAAAAPRPQAAPAPAAAPAAAAKSTEPVDEESIADMLLYSEEGNADAGSDIDSGSTVMQVLKPEELEQLQTAGDKTPYRPQAAKKAADPNTASAAKAILEKYRRRPKA